MPFVNAWFPPERRGLAIGIFGAGMGGTAISALTTVKLYTNVGEQGAVPDHRRRARGLRRRRVAVLRDAPGRVAPTTSLMTRLSANARLPITWQACILYAVAFGGYVAFSVYLPAYLKTDYGLTPADAANRMAGFVVVAVIMRPVGGWLSDRFGPIPVLAAGYAVVVVGAGLAATHPLLEHVGTFAFLAMAAALGAGSGATFALIARVTEPSRVGGVTGLVGAAGGLGGFVPAADHGLRLRPHRLLRDRAVDAVGHRRPDAAAHRDRRPPTPPPRDRKLVDQLVEEDQRHRDGRGARPTRWCAAGRFFTKGTVSEDLRTLSQVGRPRGRRLLPGPVEPRQGGALHPRRELHRVVLVEGLRQGRDHHLGDPADRLPVGRARTPRSTSPAAARGAPRSPGTPTRRPGCATPTSAACCSRCTARPSRSTAATRCKAWAHIVENPLRAKAYKSARGKGGLVRATWDEATEIVAAAHVHTIKKYGPDRVAGFSPIPAMSMVSHASGARFVNLIGGSMLSFYDWYADLPVASPQVFGDQTDVPESGDWWNAGYLIMWGSNLPVTRTPDAHWMTEARYRGQKVVAVAPDYADNVKFADEWLPAKPGTDAALAMAMGHVVLKEFFVDRQTPYFTDYVKTLHRPAVPGDARRGRPTGDVPPRRQVPDRRRPPGARARGERRVQDRPDRRAHRRARGPERLARAPLRRHRGRPVEPRARRRRPQAVADRHLGRHRCWCGCRASTPPTAPRPTCRAACRCAGSAATW